jgi:hypothetical protein
MTVKFPLELLCTPKKQEDCRAKYSRSGECHGVVYSWPNWASNEEDFFSMQDEMMTRLQAYGIEQQDARLYVVSFCASLLWHKLQESR